MVYEYSDSSTSSSEYGKRDKKRKHHEMEDSSDSGSDTVIKKHKKTQKHNKVKKTRKHKHVHKKTHRGTRRGRRNREHVIFTALVRKDRSDSRIPVIFSLESTSTFAALKQKVLEACGVASRKAVQCFYVQNDLRVQLCETTWEAFLHYLKGRTDYTVSLELEIVSSKVDASIQSKGPSTSFLSANLPRGSQTPNTSVLKMIAEKEWSSVFIYGLSKNAREGAMRELVTEHLKISQCKQCPTSHSSKVAVAKCPEELPGELKKLLTACELRKFFDKRAKVRKVYGSADLLLNPLFAQCPICASVVSLGHFNDIIIKQDNLFQHIKSCHVDDPVRSCYRGM